MLLEADPLDDRRLFAFESDFVASLRCIPMAVRMKLDRVAIKLTLRQWSRFTHQDRQALLAAPCRTAAQVSAYRACLVDLVARRAHEVATPLAAPSAALSEALRDAPPVLTAYVRAVGVPAPTAGQWRRLSELQRFALIKLTRDNHDNVNFIPAMQEFGLIA